MTGSLQSTFPAQAGSIRTVVEPALEQWPALGAQAVFHDHLPADLRHAVNQNARLFHSQPLDAQGPLWVTGHQAWLWHPGILAKDIAAAAAARRFGGQALHLVVDHDVHDALHLDLPIVLGRQLSSLTLELAPTRLELPAASQPPASMPQALATLKQFHTQYTSRSPAQTRLLEKAMADLPAFDTLGQQMAAITHRLLAPWTGPVAMLLTSQLCQLEAFKQLIHEMLHDAMRCMNAYNQAVLAHPQAGIGPLTVERDRVELPLWLLNWGKARQPVYADLADSTPLLVTADGRPIPESWRSDSPLPATSPRLAPRAMLLTAGIRRHLARLFIHGTGGGVYDRVTESWWSRWRPGQSLAPMAVVTADLRLRFDVPVASAAELRQAVWRVHHLPHNLNRLPDLPPDAQWLADEKQALLAQMSLKQDKAERAGLFRRLHEINDQLTAMMPETLSRARAALVAAEVGLNNHAQAMRRDWCFALYDDETLARLAQAMGMTPSAE